jgi:hypothetical protein
MSPASVASFAVLVCTFVSCLAGHQESGPVAPLFIEADAATGIDFTHLNGGTGEFYLPEITGQGGALFDFDNDGDLDLYCVQSGMIGKEQDPRKALLPWTGSVPPCGRLYRNDLTIAPDGRRTVRFKDVTSLAGIRACGYGMGVAAADVDNDGWIDLYLTHFGPNQLFHNNGDGTFTEVKDAGGAQTSLWSTSAAFLDYDRDGWLDLYVADYVDFDVDRNIKCITRATVPDYCTPSVYASVPDRLFHNRGDGTFEDVTIASGVGTEAESGLGVVAADLNGDGWTDIFVADDTTPNLLWINQKDGRFSNEALWSGVALSGIGKAQAGMGVDANDFDGDGDEDIVVAHIMGEAHILFRNQGNGLFDDRTAESGLGRLSLRYTAFGTGFFDFDNDGWLDLFMANGAVSVIPELHQKGDPYPFSLGNTLLHNSAGKNLEDVTSSAGPAFRRAEVSRGTAFGDVDNDGDPDIVVFNNSGPTRLLLNQLGSDRNWIGLRLVGKDGRRDMLGARVQLVPEGGPPRWRRAHQDGSYCSSNDPRVLIGLDRLTKIKEAQIIWPDGTVERWRDLPVNRYSTLRQGSAPK